jgi:hypothetical protein
MSFDDTTSVPFSCPDHERWLSVPGWPGYEVSDFGRVRSFRGRCGGTMSASPHPMNPRPGSDGRIVVRLRNGPGRQRVVGPHVLVLEAFVGPRPEGMEGCHDDGDARNNRLDNVRWDTRSENIRDMLRHGTSPRTVLTSAAIPLIWARLVANEHPRSIAEDYGVSAATIYPIRTGRTWSHVTRELPGWPIYRTSNRFGENPVRATPELIAEDESREIWMVLPDWPAYQVSSRGRIISHWSLAVRGVGGARGRRIRTEWRELKRRASPGGHLFFDASGGDGRHRHYFIHKAVLTTFVCPQPDGLVACHDDGNPANNRLNNLRWDTRRSNMLDRFRSSGVEN